MLAGISSSSFNMCCERITSLSNKGIDSKSGNSMVQFLTLSTLKPFSAAEAPQQFFLFC